MGDEMRRLYGGLASKTLRTTLRNRRKSVIVTERLARNWIDTYGTAATSSSASSTTMKRPAAASGSAGPSSKRALISGQSLDNALQIEETCGDRYRSEVTDIGLGVTKYDMKKRLLDLGYSAKAEACQQWLNKYRTGSDVKDGNVAILERSRQTLQRWYYVDGLRGSELQRRYQTETGYFVDAANLTRWLKQPAQQLPNFQHNEEVHAHACGEFVLQRLQRGTPPQQVVEELLKQYLVHASLQRVLAYRLYREQAGEYWSLTTLEPMHWKFLYDSVSLERRIGHIKRSAYARHARIQHLLSIRTALCQKEGIAEDRAVGV